MDLVKKLIIDITTKKDKMKFKLSYLNDYFQFYYTNFLYLLKLKKRLKYDPNYSCPYCGSCGIIECCRPTKCVNHPKGHYCKYYQDAYKVSDMTLTEFWKKLDKNKYYEVENKLSEIYYENYKKVFYDK